MTDKQDFRGAYVAPFYRQAKAIAWDYFKRFCGVVPGVAINESELRIDFPNGARIQLFGADNADALRGMFFDFLIADEYGDWKPSVWAYVIRPALADRGGKAIIIGTPKGRNQFWEVYLRAKSSPEWLVLKIVANSSGILPEAEYGALKSELSEDAWRQEMECDFDAAIPGAIWGKEIYQLEQEGRVTEVPYDPAMPVHTAWDLGFTDDTVIWWYQVVHGEVRVLDYYAGSGLKIEDYVAQIVGRPYRYGIHHLPHDAKAKTLASGGKSIIEQMGAYLKWESLAITTDLSLQDGIQAARLMFPRIWFDRRCYDGIEALKQYQREYDEDKKAFRDKPRHDWTSHAADAFRYMAVCWREEAKPDPAPDPPKWPMVGQTNVTLNDLWDTVPRRSRKI